MFAFEFAKHGRSQKIESSTQCILFVEKYKFRLVKNYIPTITDVALCRKLHHFLHLLKLFTLFHVLRSACCVIF